MGDYNDWLMQVYQQKERQEMIQTATLFCSIPPIVRVCNKSFAKFKQKTGRGMAYIEIKTRKYIDAALAQQIIEKHTVIGVLTTGKISTPAKKLFDEANIAWAENIPEKHFMDVDGLEVL